MHSPGLRQHIVTSCCSEYFQANYDRIWWSPNEWCSAMQIKGLTTGCMIAILASRAIVSELQSDELPSFGYCAYTLLRTADYEVQAGLKGSKSVHLKAIEALYHIIQLLDDVGAHTTLAFLLPGLFSGLTRGLQNQGEIKRHLFIYLIDLFRKICEMASDIPKRHQGNCCLITKHVVQAVSKAVMSRHGKMVGSSWWSGFFVSILCTSNHRSESCAETLTHDTDWLSI